MKKLIVSGLALAGLLTVPQLASAHHSFAAEFDSKKPVQFEGIVTKVEWTNPHVWIYFNVKGADGKVTNWGAEMGPPHGLQGGGWRRETLKIGDQIKVDGSLAKNGANRLNAKTITLASTGGKPGQRLDAASSQGKDGK
ncbi:MAG: DUF6152 family protein [Acidobacteriota bacterium]